MKHTINKQKMFFALCKQLNLDKEHAMARARKKFNEEHFSNLSDAQMDILLKSLEAKLPDADPFIEFQAWNKKEEMMYPHLTFGVAKEVLFFIQTDVAKEVDFTSVEVKPRDDFELLQFTNKRDYFGHKLYRLDVFIDRQKQKWLIEWSNRELAWVASNMETNEVKLLSAFSAVKKLGSIFTDLEPI